MAHVEGQRFKKKKKKSFLQKAKRYGKEGSYGKGRRLSEEEYNYYIRVFEQMKHVEGEEKEILVQNFFKELHREEQVKSLATNQIVSRILDDALAVAQVSQVVGIAQAFVDDLRAACVDPYASHVIQTLLTLSLKYIQKSPMRSEMVDGEKKEKNIEVSEEEKEYLKSYIIKVSKFVYNNLEDFVYDTYASHIVRSVLEVCSGIEVKDSIKSSKRAQTSHSLRQDEKEILTVPASLQALLPDIAKRFMMLPKISAVIGGECGSAAVQSLLLVLSTKDEQLCSQVIDHIINHGLPEVSPYSGDAEPEEGMPAVFNNNPATRLLEIVLASATTEQQDIIYSQYFEGKLSKLVPHKIGNFALQRLLSSWKNKESFESVFTEVASSMEVAHNCGHTGVIFALVGACTRLHTQQSHCLQAILRLLQCQEPESRQILLVPLLLRFLNFDTYNEKKASSAAMPGISLHGALIIQEIMNFNKPIKVVNSMLEMSSSELQHMASDPRGSHIMDAFVGSSFIGEKSRDKLIYRMKGTYTSLACSKHGSRSLEALWRVANIKNKTTICTELVEDELKLKGNHFGNIIYNNFQVRHFKRSDKSDWQQLIDAAEKKRKMFDDLLQDDTTTVEQPKKKKKKKKDKEKSEEDDIFIDTTGNISE